MIRRMLMGLALLAAPALLSAPAAAADEIEKAGKVYKQFCSHCHGIGMVNPGNSSYDLRKFPQDDKERFLASVMQGKGDMPAWGDILLPEELEQLWLYVSTRGGKEQPGGDANGGEQAAAPPESAEAVGEQSSAAPAPAGPLETVKEGRLSACLPLDGGALSGRRAGGGAGLEWRLLAALADAAGLAPEGVWYESEQEEESDPAHEVYAMLSMGLCDLVMGEPLYEGDFGPPPAPSAAPPRWVDRPDSWRIGTFVPLRAVALSRPYRRAEMGFVMAPSAEGRDPQGFDDLSGLVVGVQQGTLGGALLGLHLPGPEKRASVMAPPGGRFLWRLETGEFDAALVDVDAWDHHRMQNRVTKLRLGSWRHAIGFNIGVAHLEENTALGAFVDARVGALLASGEIARMAAEEGATWAPPREPLVTPRLTAASLRKAF
ncbi:c-type cytochrome [Rhodovulum sp. DZ06]|uniref:c-type cytochrome n=1 Tax=Rhodovulum sp. DZ06 TaxID=3425126 RepID=UPI003D32BA8B